MYLFSQGNVCITALNVCEKSTVIERKQMISQSVTQPRCKMNSEWKRYIAGCVCLLSLTGNNQHNGLQDDSYSVNYMTNTPGDMKHHRVMSESHYLPMELTHRLFLNGT